MGEINLMKFYPHSTKDLNSRIAVNDEDLGIARKFGKEYFDGDRKYGYGGYYYNPRFWTETVRYLREFYHLSTDASILDVGCGKGFMLHDFKSLLPNAAVAGLDISEYAYNNSMEDIKPYITLGNARELPFSDKSFDLVTAINTVHNLPLRECKQAIREIQRVSRSNSFIVVDAWRNNEERERHFKWVVTCLTAMHVDDWKVLFEEVGYVGDYYWTFS